MDDPQTVRKSSPDKFPPATGAQPASSPQSAISTKLFLALGFITLTAIIAGGASIIALNRFQDDYNALTNSELPTLKDTAQISQLSMSVAGRGASLIISPTTWTRLNLIGQVKDDADWLEEIINRISAKNLSGNRKQELLALKEQLFETYNTLNTLTENRIVYGERLAEIDTEMTHLQEDLVAVQFSTNLPDGTIAPSGPLRQWNVSIHSVVFMLMRATRLKHTAPLSTLEQRATQKLTDVRGQHAYLPSEVQFDAQDILLRLDAIMFGRNGLFHVKKLDIDTSNQIQATLRNARSIAEQFIATADFATRDIRNAISETNRNTSRSMDVTLQAMMGFILVSALVAVATFLYVSRTVLRRLGTLRESMLAHADGAFVRIDTSGDDEITDMAQSLQYLVDTLHSREAGLMDARDEAEKASVAKTRFLAAASHDLRQPLQALNLFVYALENKETDPDKREIITLIRNSLDSLKELLNTLLDISKLEAGVVQPSFKDFGIDTILARIKSELTAVAWANDLELRTVNCTAWVHCDPSLLETIVRNLVDNAIKYTDQGRVLIGCRNRGDKLRIEVCDTGPGIAADKRELIFQDFYQINNEARHRSQGLGLGLSIVRRMSNLLGCTMGCDSNLGHGSTFWIEVPRATHELDVQETLHPTPLNRGNEHIVVIEDDEHVLLGLKSLLESAGYTTQTFHTAHTITIQDAFASGAKIPDLIIADYRLDAELTGRDAIDMIRKTLAADIPAFIITGDTAPERLREAKRSGLPILHKPVQPEELMAMVRKTLSSAVSGTGAPQARKT